MHAKNNRRNLLAEFEKITESPTVPLAAFQPICSDQFSTGQWACYDPWNSTALVAVDCGDKGWASLTKDIGYR